MKKILGLDIGTNSIGWALLESDFENRRGSILGSGVRIIPMPQDKINDFDKGNSISQTAARTAYRGTRRLYQRSKLRRDRLHRILNIIGYLPAHYAESIDFDKHFGQFKSGTEVKLSHNRSSDKKESEFLFESSYQEMVSEFENSGVKTPLPHDWTLYYLRKKALTQKISKEELAWIILNFNQKRGYYQLRGENIEVDNNKEYITLKVKELKDTGEKVSDKTLYSVIFENGWVYNKNIVKTEDWLDRTKEFIVTTKELKNGEIKRTFKEVDSEVDWPAIKAKTEQLIDESNLTVGEYIYESIKKNPQQKIRGTLVKTIERRYYKEELNLILSHQEKYHPELTSPQLLKDCLMDLYSKNEAHRNRVLNENVSYLIAEDTLFYQRPLKSKKSTITKCKFESRSYTQKDKTTGETKVVNQAINAIPKSHPDYQEFRVWQFVQNIRVIDLDKEVSGKKDADVTLDVLPDEESMVRLFESLMARSTIKESQFLTYLVKDGKLAKKEVANYAWNYDSTKEYPCNTTRASLTKALKSVKDVSPLEFLTKEKEVHLWHIIYSVTDMIEYRSAIENFAKKNNLDTESFIAAFGKMAPFKNEYGTLSYKAVNKLLQLMRMGSYWSEEAIQSQTLNRINNLINAEYDDGISDRVRDKIANYTQVNQFHGLPLWLASYVVYDKHSESTDTAKWESPSAIQEFVDQFKQHSLRNPIVEQVSLETLKVIKEVWEYYGNGEKDYFDSIHLELGRNLKNSAKKRADISTRNNQNQATNERIKRILEELMSDHSIKGDVRAYSPSHQELLKLYEEGIYHNGTYTKVSEDEINKIRSNTQPSKKEIQRYKLWLEQGYLSPYTGKVISLSRLFTTDYEIEHIIPKARYFDNSMSNKVICEATVNRHKSNMTAYEYIAKSKGKTIDGEDLFSLQQYEEHCVAYFKTNRQKLKNLLSEDIPEGFINRQLNDTRYISKYLKNLLNNIVRKDGEVEGTAVNLLAPPGAITSMLKYQWGANDVWNELIAPRFKRLNKEKDTEDYGYYDKEINAYRIAVPQDLRQGFNKKRIDHRHHALDAIIIACVTRDHIHYLNSLNANNTNYALKKKLFREEKGNITKHYIKPWKHFTTDVKAQLNNMVITFKSNTRVINKTNNKIWKYVQDEKQQWNKKLVKQTKGSNWAVRKPLHEETITGKADHIPVGKHKIAATKRISLTEVTNAKILNKIVDKQVIKLLTKHLDRYTDESGKHVYAEAFSHAGIEDLNNSITALNDGKHHHPIKKVKTSVESTNRPLGDTYNNPSKYVKAAKGTNLYFAIYLDEKKGKRTYSTVSFADVVEHQQQVAYLPPHQRTPIPIDESMGSFLFALSPGDLVYIPTDSEIDNPRLIDKTNLTDDQVKRIYRMVSSTKSECHFTPLTYSTEISKNELGSNNKNERIIGDLIDASILDSKGKDVMIKARCWKLKVNRIGQITAITMGNNTPR